MSAGPSSRSEVERAEQVVNGATERAERFLHQMTEFVERAAARSREEAEDFWAEAQAVRHGEPVERQH